MEKYKPYKRELKSFLMDHVFYSAEELLYYWFDAIVAWLNKIIILFNVVYVQILKISNCSKDMCTKSVWTVI